jgi:hypothetical protein
MSSGRRCLAAAALVASLALLAQRAPAQDEGLEEAVPEGAEKETLEDEVIEPRRPGAEEDCEVSVVRPKRDEEGRRVPPLVHSIESRARYARGEAIRASEKVEPYFESEEERYRAWTRYDIRTSLPPPQTGTLGLSGVESTLELVCPRRIAAGETIALSVASTGRADTEWDAFLVYPDGSIFERQRFSAGKKCADRRRVRTFSFPTFRADCETPTEILGVRVESVRDSEFGKTFWVEIDLTPPKERPAPTEIPAPGTPMADPEVRSFLEDLAPRIDEAKRRELEE